MKYNKIFVIGFNKTATTTFHHLFLKMGLSSCHSTDWGKDNKIHNTQCFSDGDNHINDKHPMNFKNLEKEYPNSLFILNVRELNSWLLSRAKHATWVSKKNSIFDWPATTEQYRHWISKRIYHHNDVLNYFNDKTEKLIIVNTDHCGWIEFVSTHIGFRCHEYFSENVSRVKEDDQKFIHAVNVLQETFDELKYTDGQRKSLNLNKRLAVLYKHNVDWNRYQIESSVSFVLRKKLNFTDQPTRFI